ncbi:MAG: hypothetical protein R8L53_04410 [Mariprofundales bacterium]
MPTDPAEMLNKLHWHGLRKDVSVLAGQTDRAGRKGGILHDALTGRYYSLNEASYNFLLLLESGVSIADAWQHINSQRAEPAAVDYLMTLFEFLEKNHLLYGSAPEEPKQERWQDRLMHAYVFFRIPLLHPNDWLIDVMPRMKFLYETKWLNRLMMLLAVLGGLQISIQWEVFWNSFDFLTTSDGIIASMLCLVLLKIGHEFGHASTAVYLGQRVRQMGVAFIVFWPILYTDTTDAWQVSRQKRFRIDVAGMKIEFYAIIVAMFLWGWLPDGVLKSLAFYMLTVASISTLFINLNPFMRFDGYYLLSHSWHIDNLQPKTYAWLGWANRRFLFDWQGPPPFDTTVGERRIYLWYGLGCVAYRVFITVSIALAVYVFFFNALGLLLVALEAYIFLLRPIIKEGQFLYEYRIHLGSRRWPFYAMLTAIALLLLVPLPRNANLPAVVSPAWLHTVYAQANGVLEKSLPERLPAKMTLKNPELNYEIAQSQLNMERLILARQLFDSQGRWGGSKAQLTAEIAAEQASLSGLESRASKLVWQETRRGEVLWRNSNISAGQWIAAGMPLLRYAIGRSDEVSQHTQVRIFADANNVSELKVSDEIRFLPTGTMQTYTLYIDHIESLATPRLVDADALASIFGGELAVTASSDGRGLRLQEPRYVIWASGRINKSMQQLVKGAPGIVRTQIYWHTFGSDFMRFIIRLWKKESWQ